MRSHLPDLVFFDLLRFDGSTLPCTCDCSSSFAHPYSSSLSSSQVVETTVEIANKVGVSEVISRIVEGLKDDNEPYRRMVMETIEQVKGV